MSASSPPNWTARYKWSHNQCHCPFARLLGFLGLELAVRAADAQHDLIPAIAWNGDVVLLSPELLGVADAAYSTTISSPETS
jgi:hypothetical protein